MKFSLFLVESKGSKLIKIILNFIAKFYFVPFNFYSKYLIPFYSEIQNFISLEYEIKKVNI